MIHPDYSKAKNHPTVQRAAAAYRAVYAKGGPDLKAAETHLNEAVENVVAPRQK
jgi:hypothetical protein